MKQLMELLNRKFPIFNGKAFYVIIAISVLANPTAVWIQAHKAWSATTTEGLSLTTFCLMFILQLLGIGYSIRIKESPIFVAMILSAAASITVVAAILIR